MAGVVRKSFDSPEEMRPFENGQIEQVNLDSGAVGRATFRPGGQVPTRQVHRWDAL
jgi:hypothetical protein